LKSGEHKMDRRAFLMMSSKFISAAAVLPVFGTGLQPRTSVLVISPTVGVTIIRLFLDFLVAVGAQPLGMLIYDWIQDLSENQTPNVGSVSNSLQTMTAIGFTNDNYSEVNELGNHMFTYPMVADDGINCCAAFHVKSNLRHMGYMEGPTIAGIGKAAEALLQRERSNGLSRADAKLQVAHMLVPTGELNVPTWQDFNTSYNASYPSQAGEVQISYTAAPSGGQAQIRVDLANGYDVEPIVLVPVDFGSGQQA
jgi:hypothetical protein